MQETNLHLSKVAITSLGVIATLAVGTLVVRSLGPIPLAVNQTTTQKESTFNVTGESEIVTVPDQAEVTVGIEAQALTVAAAQEQANQVIAALTQQLQSLGIDKEDIKTTNYSVNPQYDYDSPTRRITGYFVSSNLRVKVQELAKVNQVIDAATAAGANQVGGVEFTLSEAKEQELTNQAREDAIEDAKADAQDLAQLAGMKLGRIVNVSEHRGGGPQPVFMEKSVMMMDGRGGGPEEPTQIEPGSSTFTYSVTLSYETY